MRNGQFNFWWRQVLIGAGLACCDTLVFLLTFFINAQIWSAAWTDDDFSGYASRWAFVLVLPTILAASGLYRPSGIGPVRELRSSAMATSLSFLLLICATFFLKSSQTYSRPVIVLTWLQLLALGPLLRRPLRRFLSRILNNRRQAVVIGRSPAAAAVVESLRADHGGVVLPVAVFDSHAGVGATFSGLPVLTDDSQFVTAVRDARIDCCIISSTDITADELQAFLAVHGELFSTLYIVPNLHGLSDSGMDLTELGEFMSLRVTQSLLLQSHRIIKRASDLALVLLSLPVSLPLTLTIALVVKVSSSGPIFYGHRRLGQNGNEFTAWKFRTMVKNADSILEGYLEENPEFRTAWENDHKLQFDPRITLPGRLLRRFSMDELPQLWNIIVGEMSLVGPRPIVEAEIPKYGAVYSIYCKVKPGLTGLWQVSGRNNTSYQRRLEYDTYYVRQWSPWLDYYIVALTFKAVIKGTGAY